MLLQMDSVATSTANITHKQFFFTCKPGRRSDVGGKRCRCRRIQAFQCPSVLGGFRPRGDFVVRHIGTFLIGDFVRGRLCPAVRYMKHAPLLFSSVSGIFRFVSRYAAARFLRVDATSHFRHLTTQRLTQTRRALGTNRSLRSPGIQRRNAKSCLNLCVFRALF